jgi:hypothetical protein
MNPFDKKIRRMFDQTGISGLMLAKLDISPHLHVIID